MSRRGEKGVILIVCLWLLAALSLLALGLSYRLRLESRMTGYRMRRHEMLELGRGAVAVAISRIDASPEDVTFYGQDWARPILLRPEHFGDLSSKKLSRYRVEALVWDELGRLDVNQVSLNQLKAIGAGDEGSSAVIDWRDADDAVSPLGAENGYYEGLKPPRYAKNAPFEVIYELVLLRGVAPQSFFGADGDIVRLPDPSPAWKPAAEGLRDLLTVYGSGRVNVNTAPYAVLSVTPGMTSDVAEGVIRRRAGDDGLERTEDDAAFERWDDLKDVGGMTEFAGRQLQLYGVLSSKFFNVRVQVTDMMSLSALHLDLSVERTDDGARCVSWRER